MNSSGHWSVIGDGEHCSDERWVREAYDTEFFGHVRSKRSSFTYQLVGSYQLIGTTSVSVHL